MGCCVILNFVCFRVTTSVVVRLDFVVMFVSSRFRCMIVCVICGWILLMM